MSEKKAMTLMQACRDYFGLATKPDGTKQTGMEFGKEFKALTQEDRNEIQQGLESQGYTIVASSPMMSAALNRDSERSESGNVGTLAAA